MGKPIRILSLDGGGTRGLMPSTLLNCLEKETGKPVTEMFDVIVGAATGGIITAALAAGLPTSDIVDIYLKQASYILPTNKFRRLWNPVNLFAPKYPNDNLKKLLNEKLGADTTMENVSKIHGNETVFLLASLDLSPPIIANKSPQFEVVIYNTTMKAQHPERLVDVALRTSAAVINLPLYEHYIEGGNYANDPALVGFSFCMNAKKGCDGATTLPDNRLGLGADLGDIRLLSLGCGSDGGTHVPKSEIKKGNWGLIKWMNRLTSLVIDTNMVYTQHLLREILDEKRYYRINPYYKSDAAPEVLKNEKLKIDVQKKEHLEAIHAYAIDTFEQEKERIKEFLEI